MNATLIALREVGTSHVWFAGVGQPAGCDLIAEEGEPLCLPGDNIGGDASPWWELEGDFDGERWQWDGKGSPRDFKGNTVYNLVAFAPKKIPWHQLELFDADNDAVEPASLVGRERLNQFRKIGQMDGVFFRRIGAAHEVEDDASTWGPADASEVDWTGFDA